MKVFKAIGYQKKDCLAFRMCVRARLISQIYRPPRQAIKDYITKKKPAKNPVFILLSGKSKMSNQAQVKGLVQYRAGDGPLLDIPQGPIEVELAIDSAVVSWTHEDESLNTAIPIQDYDKYVSEGAIVKKN